MILPLHDQIRARVRTILGDAFGLDDDTLNLAIETPPNRTMGDLGTPVAFELARRLRKAPRVIAQEVASRFVPGDGIARVEAAANVRPPDVDSIERFLQDAHAGRRPA